MVRSLVGDPELTLLCHLPPAPVPTRPSPRDDFPFCSEDALKRHVQSPFSTVRSLCRSQGGRRGADETESRHRTSAGAHACARMCMHTDTRMHTCTHIHTCACTRTHTHAHVCTHTRMQADVHIHMDTHIHTCAHMHACTRIHTCAHTYTHIRTRAHTFAHAHMHRDMHRARMYTHTHMCAHAYTHGLGMGLLKTK